jgi:hypothetical protein
MLSTRRRLFPFATVKRPRLRISTTRHVIIYPGCELFITYTTFQRLPATCQVGIKLYDVRDRCPPLMVVGNGAGKSRAMQSSG